MNNSSNKEQRKISDIGEKRLIREFIRPYFNQENKVEGVGDDCAMLCDENGETWLFSTDRVPADLISFRLGIINFYGLGRYLACLNLSDISACGGEPAALLLNLGLPPDLDYENFQQLCKGFGEMAARYNCPVLGGDITSSAELSISATSIGRSHKEVGVLTRRGAVPGDTIFISKPVGLTPAAFAFYLRAKGNIACSEEEIQTLNGQFTSIEPLPNLGRALAQSGKCTCCMDNTDGLGQSLLELSEASQISFIIREDWVNIPSIVYKIAQSLGEKPIELAFSAGADFSLIGTLHGNWSKSEMFSKFGRSVEPIGYVREGSGVLLQSGHEIKSIKISGWNYFV